MKITTHSSKETIAIGKKIAKYLQKGDIICLYGELGTGKTVLAKGIACGLGIKENEIISPTFVLIRKHLGKKLDFFHFDLYRLSSPKDIIGLGYEEYLYDDGITVIEWADRLRHLLPEEFLKIKLTISGDKLRLLEFSGFGKRYKELLKKIFISLQTVV